MATVFVQKNFIPTKQTCLYKSVQVSVLFLSRVKIDRVAWRPLFFFLSSLSKTHQWPRLVSSVKEHERTAAALARQMMKYTHVSAQMSI